MNILNMNISTIAIAVSFVVGFLGYIIIRFWIIPIFKYRKLKNQVINDMTHYLNSINQEDEGESIYGEINNISKSMCKNASDLTDCFHYTLPEWYKMLLNSRGESPEDATKHVMGLSNTRNYDHAQNRLEKIRQSLKI